MYGNTCCFTGHRKLSENKIEPMIKRLNDEIENLIDQGVTNLISGGALGFDMIAASLVIAKKELGFDVRLIFALPCKNQEKYWPEEKVQLYRKLLSEADEIHYVSEEYSPACMKKRNCYMVNQSAYCLCYLLQHQGGTYQTVQYAEKKGIRIINVAC